MSIAGVIVVNNSLIVREVGIANLFVAGWVIS